MKSKAIAIVVFDIDGVVRDVSNSYRRALADTVERYTEGAYRPTQDDIDVLKSEGLWNNDWEGSQEMILRYFEQQGTPRSHVSINFDELVAFFQSRYRGTDPENWNGYISQEPLLLEAPYLYQLSEANIPWGFFSGATRGSATYVLERRLELPSPVLVAMEDAPGKPDPSGLFAAVKQLETQHGEALKPNLPVVYAGDTVADMQTVVQAAEKFPDRKWIGIGVLPPHVQHEADYADRYARRLMKAGAQEVLPNIQQLDAKRIRQII
ncbi:MAG: TIGR01548 family HAD-type hydrolase [Cyanobacteria bacterium J06638_22]